MATTTAKRWAMAAVIGCGMVACGGVGVLWAGAQEARASSLRSDQQYFRLPNGRFSVVPVDGAKPLSGESPQRPAENGSKRLEADEQKRTQADPDKPAEKRTAEADPPPAKPKGDEPLRVWSPRLVSDKTPEFKYVWLEGEGLTTGEFEKQVKAGEKFGYTFVGVVNLGGRLTNNPKVTSPALVFRKMPTDQTLKLLESLGAIDQPKAEQKPKRDPVPPAVDEEKTLQAQIEQLTKQLHDLKAKQGPSSGTRVVAVYKLADLGVADADHTAAAQLLSGLIRLKYGDAALKHLTIAQTGKSEVTVQATDDAGNEPVRWLMAKVSDLREVAPKPGGR